LKTKNCGMSTRKLLAYLEAPAQHPEIEAHLKTCPSCKKKLARLSQVALSQQADRLTCNQCQARLPDYMQAQVEGQDLAKFFEVRDHLSLCPHCQRYYQELLKIDHLILSGDLPQPASYAPPDLSFLKRPSVPERLGEIIRRGAYWVQGQTRTLVVDMGTFLQVLNRQPVPALATRGEDHEPAKTLYQIVLGAENLDDLDVEVTVYRQPDGSGVARVVVHVSVPSRLLNGFAGNQVQMKARGTTRATLTDEDGRAIFENVPLDELKEATFEIIPA
jgi:hypothetical protein